MIAAKTYTTLALAAALLLPAVAHAQSQPTGVWIDHTGRGAVEITQCEKALCGHIVWLKDATDKQACRTQVIGNVQPVGGGVWDRGWIFDPDKSSRFSVELKPIGNDSLRVVGYLGTKLLSETMTWRRAPADLQRCDAVNPDVAPSATVAKVAPQQAPPAAQKKTAQKTAPKASEPRSAQVPQSAVAPQVAIVQPPPSLEQTASATATVLPTVTPPPEQRPEARNQRRSRAASTREARRAERSRGTVARRGYGRSCGIYLPYVSVRYPCNVLSML